MLGTNAQEINQNIQIYFNLEHMDYKIWKNAEDFFQNKKNWDILLKFLKNTSKISLRVIDYFLTTYCSINKIEYLNSNIFLEYKNQLKKYHKKYFDPCSRGIKIPFFYDKDTCIITTICQLNFFKWFIETNIYQLFLNLYQEIKKYMKYKKHLKYKNTNNINYLNNNIIYCSTKKDIKVMFD